MSHLRPLLARIAFAVALATAAAGTAHAAESYDNCTQFIDSVPATISTQGVWCLRKDLSTAITSGAAITIATNNVTIDCNDFKLGGLAAGDASQTRGILAVARQNATVRRCNVRGFYKAIALGGSGHLVENNRLDNNLFVGIEVTGENNTVQGNRLFDTGGTPGAEVTYGMDVAADVIDNTVEGVFGAAALSAPVAIRVAGAGADVRGNRVRGLVPTGGGVGQGIVVEAAGVTVSQNHLSAAAAISAIGIVGAGSTSTFCAGNTVAKFQIAIAASSCQDLGGNGSN